MAAKFYDTLSTETKLPQATVKKVMASIIKMTVKSLSDDGRLVIPGYATLKLQKKAARAETVKKVFGKEVTVAARAASSVVRISPVKKLRDLVQA